MTRVPSFLYKALFAATLTALALFSLVPSIALAAHKPPRPPAPSVIWVSPFGNDRNPGTQASPIKTLTHARDLVRKLLPNAHGNVSVNLESGTFRLAQPLLLNASDSGRGANQVVWTAAPGSTPIVSGAIRVQGWTQSNPALNIWSAPVPAHLNTRQIYVNGTRAMLASGPVPTQLTKTATGYTMSSSDMSTWHNPSVIDFVYTQQLGQMTEPICPIASIGATVITMAQPCWDNSNNRQINSVTKWYDANLVGWNTLHLPTYVENAYEVLTRPGQFYLDPTLHRLYYIPRPGQNMATADVEAPTLQSLVQGAGSPATPLRNVVFRGIEFSSSTWLQPGTPDGFSELQSGYTLTGDDAWQKEGLCHLIKGGECPYGAWTKEPAAVSFIYARNVTFSRDEFVHLGDAGLDLGDGAQSDTVSRCVFTDISGNGLEIGSVDLPNAPTREQTLNITASDNHVYDIGVEFPGAAAILVGYAANTTISHNQIDDVPYTAISMGWGGWLDKLGRPPQPNYSHDNVISDNLIFNFMETVSDGGGIYTQGNTGPSLTRGEKVIGNVVHDQVNWSFALHSDDGASHITYAGNVLYNDTYEWCCNHKNATTGTGYYPQLFIGNYWQSGANSGTIGGVTEKGNHLISGPQDVPASVFDAAGIESADSSVLTWQPDESQVPVAPSGLAALYLIDDQAYLTWHSGISGSSNPVVSYTVTSCETATPTVQEPCADPGPSVSVSATAYQQTGYAVIPGLVVGQYYWFQVTASDSQGSSTPSEPSAVVEAGSHTSTVPGAPRGLSYRVSGGDISLKWSTPASADCTGPYWAGECANPVLAYEITVSNGATYIISSLSQLVVSNGGGIAITVVTGLTPGGQDRVSISAITPAGTGAQLTSGWIQIPPRTASQHRKR